SGLRQTFHAEDFNWRGWRSLGHLISAVIEHGANFAVHVAHDEVVAGAEGAVLHEHGCDRTASAIELGFEHDAGGRTVSIGTEFLEIGDQADHFHQQIQVGLLLGGNVNEYGCAAPVFWNEAAIAELLLYAIR